MRVLRDAALMFARRLKQPVRSGVYGMRGCIRGSSPSPPAALGSLHTCAQGAAAAIVGPLGSSLVRVRVSLPSGARASRCVREQKRKLKKEPALTELGSLKGASSREVEAVHGHTRILNTSGAKPAKERRASDDHVSQGGRELMTVVQPRPMTRKAQKSGVEACLKQGSCLPTRCYLQWENKYLFLGICYSAATKLR
ncbi:hypothetical protein NDU88_005683 [Pleurodeles waltl]|uniref:Uncharacterized protein n=1 Tax=Pleurodeles waltl TaxID=8319 RepID=A0AAV7VP93_PLEWA|nr:hypothetical protein NDU88_005683 [Pleurodeles waltl]